MGTLEIPATSRALPPRMDQGVNSNVTRVL